MRVVVRDFTRPVISNQRREFFGEVYDESGNLFKKDILISEINPVKGGWHWKTHVLINDIINENQGTRVTYQEAWAEMQAYINQS